MSIAFDDHLTNNQYSEEKITHRENIFGVLVIYHLVENKYYVLTTIDAYKTMSRLMGKLKSSCCPNVELQYAFNKNPDLEVWWKKFDTIEEARKERSYLTNEYIPKGMMFNTLRGVFELTDEQRRKMSENAHERMRTPEARERNRQRRLGRKHTPENKEKLADILREASKVGLHPITINGIDYKSISQAARDLSVSRVTIYRRMKKENKNDQLH